MRLPWRTKPSLGSDTSVTSAWTSGLLFFYVALIHPLPTWCLQWRNTVMLHLSVATARKTVFRCVHLNSIWNAYFSLSLSHVWIRKGLIFLCVSAMTGMVQLQPHGRLWWNSHLSEIKPKVSVLPFTWTDLLGNLLPRWAKQSSGLPKHHPVVQGFTPFYELFRLIEWHNTKPVTSNHKDFG